MGSHCFEVDAVCKIIDPDKDGKDRYIVQVNIKNLPHDFNTKTNPRPVNKKSKVYKALLNSIKTYKECPFHLKNRGITLTAANVSVDLDTESKRKIIKINTTDDNLHGLIDGGHTYDAIKEAIEDLDDFNPVFCTLEIIQGAEAFFEDISLGKNTSKQVEDVSIANQKGLFENLAENLKNTPLEDKVALTENIPNLLSVKDVICLMKLFDHKNHGTDDPPLAAYTSKGSVSDQFIRACETGEKDWLSLQNLLPQIIDLANYIEQNIPKAYNKAGNKYGARTKVGVQKSKKGYSLTFDPEIITEYYTPRGFLYPIISSFRCLLKYDTITESYKWLYNPKEVFERSGTVLITSLLELAEGLNNKPDKVGRSKHAWNNAYNTVYRNYIELMMEKQQMG
jgi:hypothetical protein